MTKYQEQVLAVVGMADECYITSDIIKNSEGFTQFYFTEDGEDFTKVEFRITEEIKGDAQ